MIHSPRQIIVIGGGGHALVLVDILKLHRFDIRGFTDRGGNPRRIEGVEWLGDDDCILRCNPSEILLVNGIGSASSTLLRRKVFLSFKQAGYAFAQVIHPAAVVSTGALLGEGVQIMAGAIVQPACRIGANVILNTRCVVDHESRIADHAHIAPGVTLSGRVSVGEGAHVGTGASVIQDVSIGSEALVAAGAVVVSDVAAGTRVLGVPARARH